MNPPMDLIVYYEGANSIESWVSKLLPGYKPVFKKLPTSNKQEAFALLPKYVSDILYLDKPDIIISGTVDGIHEKPIFSIELAACTPQYQHALQRFPRMLASVENKCPSILIMALEKSENNGGARLYRRSQAIDYGAVRLMDIFGVPAFVFDWPTKDGTLQFEGSDALPPLNSVEMKELSAYLLDAISAFINADYMAALMKQPRTRALIDKSRQRAYGDGAPTIERPGGGTGAASKVKLEKLKTTDLLAKIISDGRSTKSLLNHVPAHIKSRTESVVMYPTRVVKHAGDPYVGMLCYYDIAFCRVGDVNRDRQYNLIAYCNGVKKAEMENAMASFKGKTCPLGDTISLKNVVTYSYHLRNGCSHTKSKPIRIYAEMADMIVFEDGVLFGG